MGVKLRDLVEPTEITLESLSGKTLAVDAMNTIFQFLSIIRQPDGTPLMDSHGEVTSHLSGLFFRTARMIETGIRPIYVFDGIAPLAKSKTQRERQERKEEAAVKYEKAKEAGDEEAMRKYAQQTSQLTKAMIEDSKKLLRAMGVPCVQAPGEGEAQAAAMCRSGQVYSVASQDYDSLMFGSPRLIRNLSITGRRKVPRQNRFINVVPELIELDKFLSALRITQLDLIKMGLLVGTDYNPGGIRGIGPKKALKAVKENRFDELSPDSQWLIELFTNPDIDEAKIERPAFDADGIVELMCAKHDYGEERIRKAIDELIEAGKKGKQQGLGEFF